MPFYLIRRTAPSALNLVAEGDSITASGVSYAYTATLPTVTTRTIKAVSNSTLATVQTRIAADEALIDATKPNVLSLMIGANDTGYHAMPNGAALLAGDIALYLAARRSAGFDYILLGTLLPETTAINANFNTFRAAFNAIVKAPGWAAAHGVDAIFDIGADATMGPDAAASDTALYPDGLHPSELGHTYLAPIYAAVVNGLGALLALAVTTTDAYTVREGDVLTGFPRANAKVTWTKSGADAGLVTLNATTGEWSLPGQVYASKPSVSFSLIATRVRDGATATQPISVTVTQAASTPAWLPDGAVTYADFVNGNYYAAGAEQASSYFVSSGSIGANGLSGDIVNTTAFNTALTSAGTMVVELGDVDLSPSEFMTFQGDDTSFYYQSGGFTYYSTLNAGPPAVAGTWSAGAVNKLAFTHGAGAFDISFNGSAAISKTVTDPSYTALFFGSSAVGRYGPPVHLYVRKIATYPAQSPSALPALTA